MPSQWYYLRNGQQQGPVDSNQLKQLAGSGSIKPTDLIWKEGLKDWVPAGRIKGLFPEAAGQQPSQSPPSYQQPQAPQYQPMQPTDYGTAYGGHGGYGAAQTFAKADIAYSPGSFDTLFKAFVGCLFGGVLLLIVLIVASVVMASPPHPSRPQAAPEPAAAAILFFMLGYLVIIAGFVIQLILLYRCWNVIQDGNPRTSAGQAVGFLFIPFFNVYWIFQAYYGLAQDMDEYCSQRSLPSQASPGMALAVCILSFVPCLAVVNAILLPVLMNQFAKTAATITAWHQEA